MSVVARVTATLQETMLGSSFEGTLAVFRQYHQLEANNLAHLVTSPLGVVGLLAFLFRKAPSLPAPLTVL